MTEQHILSDNDTNELFGEKPVRWYQIAARTAVENALENGCKRILVEMATGVGKTLTSGLIFSSEKIHKILGVENRKLKLLFIAHKHRLLTQAENEYANALNVEFISHSAFAPLPENTEWDIACIDECHHEAMASIQYLLEKVGDKPIIGLTATPDRADGLLLKFDLIVNPISREQAVEMGYISASSINTIYDTPKKDKTDTLKDVLNNFAHEMGKTLVFMRTKKEVQSITEHLIELGYSAIGLLNQSAQEINDVLNAYSRGEYQFIVNCGIISEGVDVKGCTDVILAKNIGSYPLLNQIIGRTVRPDSPSNVWEFINPLSDDNLDSTIVVGTPTSHRLLYKKNRQWTQKQFDYTRNTNSLFGETHIGM